MLCQIVTGPKFQNLILKCCFLTWHKASQIFDCWGYTIFFLNTFLETVPGGLFDYFCKSKKIRETEQKMCFSFDQVKNNVAHFEGLKKLQEKGRYSQICFWKWKFCRARARPNLPILGNWTHTNITDRQQCIQFRKSPKRYKITPPYCIQCTSHHFSPVPQLVNMLPIVMIDSRRRRLCRSRIQIRPPVVLEKIK